MDSGGSDSYNQLGNNVLEINSCGGQDTRIRVGDLSSSNMTGWHQIGYVYHSGTLTTYLDGTFVDSKAISYVTSANPTLYLGSARDFGQKIRGKIDEFGVWNRALSDSEITQLYNMGAGGTSLK